MNREQGECMQLKPQDIVVLLKLVGHGTDWSYRSLAEDLSLSTGEVHNALDRATRAKLYDPQRKHPRVQSLEEFLLHGIKYAFPAERGSITRGIPTAHAAPPLNALIRTESDEPPPVWPDPQGSALGYRLEPLHSSAPKAAKSDKSLYELLALVDSIRDGRTRERNAAAKHLHERLRAAHAPA
jgi:hypothetical protein